MGTSDFLLIPNGRAAIFRCPPFCGHTGRECAVRRSYRLLSENRSVGGKRAFQGVFACCGRFHRCGCASSGCGCGWPACVMRRVPAPSGEPGPAQTHTYIKEAATLPFRNVAAVWTLRPVVRLSLSVRSRRCSAGRCCVRRRRRYSNCRSVPLRPPRRRAGSQRSRSPSAVRSRRPKPRSSSSCPSTAGARTRRRPPLPT